MKDILISGFSDEIASEFEIQLKTVKELGMHYISLRTADGINIADYTIEQVQKKLIPILENYSINVSSLGSPIGKIDILDEIAFDEQLIKLETLCKICNLLNCKYIRMFSFFLKDNKNPDDYSDTVVAKLKKFADIAKKYDVILIHENEKDIYGDIASRCKYILDKVDSENFKAVFDFANFVQCEENPVECYECLKEYIVYIHIKDAVTTDKENVVCGTGEGKIPEILANAINDGYKGFLTLEPHLVLFDALQSLEIDDAKDIIKENKAKDGAEGYKMQYDALMEILKNIK